MQMRFRRYAVVLCCTLALSTGGWATAEAHDGHTHATGAAPVVDVLEKAAVVAPASRSDGKPDLRRSTGKLSDRFPNILLRTQDNTPVRFYDDLVKDRIVIINFIYTTCYDICPGTTGNLMRVHQHLGDRVGRDIL